MWVWPLIILVIFEVTADIFAKEWSLKDKPIFWIGAFVCYFLASVFWLTTIKSGSGLARGVTIFSVASTILAILIGVLLYKESVTSIELAGMIVGVIAIILLFWNSF